MVVTYAGRPVRTFLEIGAGTDKATPLFAQRGAAVTATEPDGAMLAELPKHVPGNVTTVQAAFENVRPGESCRLIYAAAAPHWTNPEGRWPRIAALLEPGGVVASSGGLAQLADPAVEEAVRAEQRIRKTSSHPRTDTQNHLLCRRAGDVFVLPTQSEGVPAPRPEPGSAGRTVVAAPCQGAAHRFWVAAVVAWG